MLGWVWASVFSLLRGGAVFGLLPPGSRLDSLAGSKMIILF